MKKVIIIDDEPLARQILMEYLQAYNDITMVAECKDGFEGLKAINTHQPDLIFLDIQMPKINGFELLELLPNQPFVIFTTAFDDFAIQAFEANAIDYLLKPISEARFKKALDKWRSKNPNKKALSSLLETPLKQGEEKNRIVVKTNSEIKIIPVSDVFYLEAYDDYIKIFTKDHYYLKKKTMNYYEQVLDSSLFFRTHRSYIINLQQLNKIEPLEKSTYVAILKNGKQIPISRSQYPKLKDLLGI